MKSSSSPAEPADGAKAVDVYVLDHRHGLAQSASAAAARTEKYHSNTEGAVVSYVLCGAVAIVVVVVVALALA